MIRIYYKCGSIPDQCTSIWLESACGIHNNTDCVLLQHVTIIHRFVVVAASQKRDEVSRYEYTTKYNRVSVCRASV